MKRVLLTVAAVMTLAVAPSAAQAKWKLVEAGAPTEVAKSDMTVTPDVDWNRWSVRPIKTSEIWTLDGTQLNELYFVSALQPGATLFRDAKKKDRPLPTLAENAQLTDIPDFVESSIRVVLDTSVFEITNVEPATMGGKPAVRFTYEYAVQGNPLKRRGMGLGSLVDGALNLVTYTAPVEYFYDRDLAKAEAVMSSISFQ